LDSRAKLTNGSMVSTTKTKQQKGNGDEVIQKVVQHPGSNVALPITRYEVKIIAVYNQFCRDDSDKLT